MNRIKKRYAKDSKGTGPPVIDVMGQYERCAYPMLLNIVVIYSLICRGCYNGLYQYSERPIEYLIE